LIKRRIEKATKRATKMPDISKPLSHLGGHLLQSFLPNNSYLVPLTDEHEAHKFPPYPGEHKILLISSSE
jgi:hypothetical protein